MHEFDLLFESSLPSMFWPFKKREKRKVWMEDVLNTKSNGHTFGMYKRREHFTKQKQNKHL